MLLSACVPRELIYQAAGKLPPSLRDFAADFSPPISRETLLPVSGFGGNGGGVSRVPVIFVHGNIESPAYWLNARKAFKAAGYTDDELWAVGYGWQSTRALDNSTLSAVTLERFVAAVQAYLEKKTGKPVPRFDLIGHSLGVTLVRDWMRQSNRWHSVRAFVGIAGANQGTWTSGADTRGQNRVVSFELHPGSPWLAELNAIGETPGPTRYFTLYDGTGWADVLFPKPLQDSGALKGATNLAFNRERGTYFGHLLLGKKPQPLQQVLDWLQALPSPKVDASAPEVLRAGAALTSSQQEARLYCSNSAEEPRLEGEGLWRVEVEGDAATSCFAYNPKTHLASPLVRHWRGIAADNDSQKFSAIEFRPEPPPGAYTNPQYLKVVSSEPGVQVLISSTLEQANPGAPLLQGQRYIPGPVRLTVQAFTADGRRSAPVHWDYDISIEKIDADYAWARQVNEDADSDYRGLRQQGN